MKIQIDANPVYSNQLTGIGYFTDELIKHISEEVTTEGFAFNFLGKKSSPDKYKVQEQKFIPGKILTMPRYAGLDLPLRLFFRLNHDLVLGTNFLLPPTGKVKNVTVVHDLCFIDHPEWVQGKNAMILRKMLGKTLSRSSGVIANSSFTASRIRDYYSYSKPILVISIPPKKSTFKPVPPNSLEDLKDFYLFISTIEPRKNVKTLLDAFEELPKSVQEKHKLVLAGKPGWDEETIKRLRINTNKNIIYLDYVSEAERNWLYKKALATVIPSHYEGFGMMTLESLDAGTPVITSDIPPQREILGDSGVYFKPTDKIKLTGLLMDLADHNKRESILAKQSMIINNYTWEKTAKEVLDFCESIIKNDYTLSSTLKNEK